MEDSIPNSDVISAFSRHTFLSQACQDLWPELEPYAEIKSSPCSQIIATFEPDTKFYIFILRGKVNIYKGEQRIGELSTNQSFAWSFLTPGNTRTVRLETALPAELIVIQFANTTHALSSETRLLGRLLQWFTFLPEPGTQNMEKDVDLIGLVRKYKHTQNHLFSIFNYDLRSPVASLISLLDLSQSELKEGNFNMVDQLLGDMRELADVHLRMLENLKKWAELRAGRKKPVFRQSLVDNILSNATALVLPYYQKKEITLCDQVLHKDTQLTTDPEFASYIIHELLINACKFSYRHQQVIIQSDIKDNKLSISIKDEGKGLKPHVLEGLFTPGKNKIDYGTENETGTGLGLLIIKEMADLLGVEIRVESEPGKGSIFTLLFPLAC